VVSGTGAEVTGALPAGVRVEATPDRIAAHFPALCPLQPVRMEPAGLVCAPRCAPELAGPALAACPLPVRVLAAVPAWPDPPARMLSGWYLRSPAHLPAPAGVRELVQAPGEGFGPGGHATTEMCLGALGGDLPAVPALDAGCGSGLLAQAWAALGRGPVLGVDLDPRALDQAARSLTAAGCTDVTLRLGPLGGLPPADLAGRVVLANIPAAAHRALLAAVDPRRPPVAVVLSGVRADQVAEVEAAWRALGLRRLVAGGRAAGFVMRALAA
jgi:SAM-dependent methyltransferase